MCSSDLGAFKNSSNLLGRKRELEELEERCKKALRVTEKIQEELDLNEGMLKEKEEELAGIRDEEHQASLQMNTLQMNINQLEEKRKEIRDSYQDLTTENEQLVDQIKKIEESRSIIARDKDTLEKKELQADESISQMNARMEKEKAERENM